MGALVRKRQANLQLINETDRRHVRRYGGSWATQSGRSFSRVLAARSRNDFSQGGFTGGCIEPRELEAGCQKPLSCADALFGNVGLVSLVSCRRERFQAMRLVCRVLRDRQQ